MMILGIDPGLNGGAAIVQQVKIENGVCTKMDRKL